MSQHLLVVEQMLNWILSLSYSNKNQKLHRSVVMKMILMMYLCQSTHCRQILDQYVDIGAEMGDSTYVPVLECPRAVRVVCDPLLVLLD